MNAYYFKHLLKFNVPSGTSRGILNQKESWFIVILSGNNYGIGECSLITGLSIDPVSTYELKLKDICSKIHLGFKILSQELEEYPSILFGLESAYRSFHSIDPFVFSKSNLINGNDSLPINGLIWMGEKSFMKNQIKEKIQSGFNCIKIKIGALDFKLECDLLSWLRSEYLESDLEIRLDANGSFSLSSAFNKLQKLSDFKIHSIEQPIKTKQWHEMAFLCEKSPIPIALDEELVGMCNFTDQKRMLKDIKPQYIIIKPSLIGGLKKSNDWVKLAESLKIKWWCTSALESNIGLNIIAQWIFLKTPMVTQGLGTGMLFSNNIESPYSIERGYLKYNSKKTWNTDLFKNYI
jgi:o-succinylbenzoate synthase